MDKASLKLILFDIDGTLLLSGRVVKDAFLGAFDAVTGEAGDLDGVRFAGNTDRSILRQVLVRHRREDDLDKLFGPFVRNFVDRLRVAFPRAEGPYLLPGVLPLLRALERAGFALAVGTGNVRASAMIKLGRFGLERFFPAGGFGDRHEDRTAVFREAIESAREHYGWAAGARSVWVVGDTAADVYAAHAVGARAIAVATGPVPPGELASCGADRVVPDLSDTREIVDFISNG
jgi:phosphoglycolate phosphatase-like HAD superfamily hydrolase